MNFVGLISSTLYFNSTDNIYSVMTDMGYLGFAVFNLVIWAAILEVVNDSEVTTHNRQDGAVYSLYSFARKAG